MPIPSLLIARAPVAIHYDIMECHCDIIWSVVYLLEYPEMVTVVIMWFRGHKHLNSTQQLGTFSYHDKGKTVLLLKTCNA